MSTLGKQILPLLFSPKSLEETDPVDSPLHSLYAATGQPLLKDVPRTRGISLSIPINCVMVLTIAHRGAGSLAPENTLPAIKKAWEIGADVVEIDVTATLDGQLILLHDDVLVRTTDVCERFPERARNPSPTFTLKEIRSLNAGSWFYATDPFGSLAAGDISREELSSSTGIAIPTLEEVLHFVHERSWRINIEIKKIGPPLEDFPITDAVLDLIDRMRIPADCVIISSFDHGYIREIASKRPDIEINALIGDLGDGRQDWGTYEFKTYNADARYTDEEQITKAHEHGCLVNLYTVNDRNDMLRFIRAGVHGLFTDFPQLLIRLQNSTGRQIG
jgi:glycerophosphoryl diester phosphodiesterase